MPTEKLTLDGLLAKLGLVCTFLGNCTHKEFRKLWYRALKEAGWTENEFLQTIYAKDVYD